MLICPLEKGVSKAEFGFWLGLTYGDLESSDAWIAIRDGMVVMADHVIDGFICVIQDIQDVSSAIQTVWEAFQ